MKEIFGVILGGLSFIGMIIGAVLIKVWIIVFGILLILELIGSITIGMYVVWYPYIGAQIDDMK